MQAKKVLQQLARLRLDVNTVFDRAISDCERSDVNETVPMLPDRLRQLEDIGRALGLSQTDFFDPTPGSTAVQKGDEWIASLMTMPFAFPILKPSNFYSRSRVSSRNTLRFGDRRR